MMFELPKDKDIDNYDFNQLKELYLKVKEMYNFREGEINRLRDDVRFLTTAIQHLPNALMIKDSTGNILTCSDELGRMFGKEVKYVPGRSSLELDAFFPREDCEQFQKEDDAMLDKLTLDVTSEETLHYEKNFRFSDGDYHPCFYWSKCFYVPDNHQENMGIVSEFVDMTKEKKLEADLELASQIDPGTGLFNRYVFDKQTKAVINDSRENGTPVSVMMCDLDHFKRVNDTFGHLEGDRVLADFANIIKAEIRTGDVAIRYGGEEFLVFLPGTDLTKAKIVAERLRAITEKQMILPDKSNITVSIGLVKFDPKETRSQCIERADEALYTAKETGRNQVVVFAGKDDKYLG